MTQDLDWAGRLCHVIAAQVRRLRTERNMSAQQLADRCAELGHPIARSVLANFESGRRPNISVPELLVIARVLEISPVVLIYGLGSHSTVEALPGQEVPTWDAVKWITGEAPFPGVVPAAPMYPAAHEGHDDYRNHIAARQHDPAGIFRGHDELVYHALQAHYRAAQLAEEAAAATSDQKRKSLTTSIEVQNEMIARTESEVREIRSALRAGAITPPALPASLAHIDAREGRAEEDGARGDQR